jgi:ATP-dependent helicase HrpA
VDELHALPIQPYLSPWLRVVDLQARLISQGRNLRLLLRDTQKNKSPIVVNTGQTGPLRSWTCGELPVERELQRGGVRFKVYPALQDGNDGVMLVELDNPVAAAQVHFYGVLRLLVLALPQQYKYARQQFTAHRQLLLLGQGMTGKFPLAEALAERAMRDCFLSEGQALPRCSESFSSLLDAHRADFNQVVSRLTNTMLNLFTEWRSVRQAMHTLSSPVYQQALADMQAQLDRLLPEDFIQSTAQPWFGHLPRYMQALSRRLERIAGNVARDAQLLQQMQPFLLGYQRLLARQSLPQHELAKLKWMLEEFRVSLFAQELRTAIPVSARRLTEQLELASKEAN